MLADRQHADTARGVRHLVAEHLHRGHVAVFHRDPNGCGVVATQLGQGVCIFQGGARGLFQFMPATAKEFGLSTFFPDERADPEKSARAAAQFLKQLHARFNDWPLAIAAYNAGGGRVSRTLAKNNATSFAEIAGLLPSETKMYVPKVLATMEVRSGVALADLAPPKS